MAEAAMETAPTDENDDNWLYGESNNDQGESGTTQNGDKSELPKESAEAAVDNEEKEPDENDGNNEDSQFNDEHFADVGRDDQDQGNDADSQDNGDSDSDDSDDVKVTIGEIKSGPQYGSLNIKRGVGLVASGVSEKPRGGTTTGNKVTLDDLEGPGSINGVPAMEFNIDTIEDKPWNKPGADISDYFNYGFNEVTWSAYCERQRRLRVSEAGVGLHAPPPQRPPPQDRARNLGPMRNDESMQPPMQNNYQVRENTIQVMTAERREYGRGGHVRDAPPDYFGAPPPDHYYPPAHAPAHAPPHAPPHAPYDEPWGHPEGGGWAPTDIKELTPGPLAMGPPPSAPVPPPAGFPPPYRGHPHAPHPHPHPHPHAHPGYDRDRERDRDRDRDRRDRERRDEDERERDRDRDRERSRSMKPDRVREKSYRRERSRSRSHRHKSRSRSPRPRDRSRDRDRDRDRDRNKSKIKDTKEKEDEK